MKRAISLRNMRIAVVYLSAVLLILILLGLGGRQPVHAQGLATGFQEDGLSVTATPAEVPFRTDPSDPGRPQRPPNRQERQVQLALDCGHEAVLAAQ